MCVGKVFYSARKVSKELGKTCFVGYRTIYVCKQVLSVMDGSATISNNPVKAMEYAKDVSAAITTG